MIECGLVWVLARYFPQFPSIGDLLLRLPPFSKQEFYTRSGWIPSSGNGGIITYSANGLENNDTPHDPPLPTPPPPSSRAHNMVKVMWFPTVSLCHISHSRYRSPRLSQTQQESRKLLNTQFPASPLVQLVHEIEIRSLAVPVFAHLSAASIICKAKPIARISFSLFLIVVANYAPIFSKILETKCFIVPNFDE